MGTEAWSEVLSFLKKGEVSSLRSSMGIFVLGPIKGMGLPLSLCGRVEGVLTAATCQADRGNSFKQEAKGRVVCRGQRSSKSRFSRNRSRALCSRRPLKCVDSAYRRVQRNLEYTGGWEGTLVNGSGRSRSRSCLRNAARPRANALNVLVVWAIVWKLGDTRQNGTNLMLQHACLTFQPFRGTPR